MSKRKNNTIDSVSKEVEAFSLAQNGLPEPPSHIKLNKAETAYWLTIVGSKRPDAWTDSDLVEAAKLAKHEVRAAKLLNRIAREPISKKDGSVNLVYKQIEAELDRVSRLILATKRHLQVHPRATHGESRKQKQRNTAARETMQAVKSTKSLIAGVTVQ